MKFKYTPKGVYCEEGQANPIRWCIVNKVGDDFVNESSWMRCKDFLNDYCVAYNGGKRFKIYGFSTEEMIIPAKGEPVYIAVTHLTDQFLMNLEAFNLWLEEQDRLLIEEYPVGEGVLVLKFPPEYFSNTHHVSLITLIIRLLNSDIAFENFEQVIAHKTFPGQDAYKWGAVVKDGKFFNIPEQYKDYVWYVNSTSNDKKTSDEGYSFTNLVHNCGVLSWINGFKGT